MSLDDVEAAARELSARCSSADFEPDVVVYVESGARLLAHAFTRYRADQVVVALRSQRQSTAFKRVARRAAIWAPRSLNDRLRLLESRRVGGLAPGSRLVEASGPPVDVQGKRVLLLDDAADSGSTLRSCRAWLEARGVKPEDIWCAVIAATTENGRAGVDAFLTTDLCRFPWSNDSPGNAEWRRMYEELGLPPW